MGSGTSPRKSALRSCRILIVEDEFLVAMELQSLLEGQGCEVVGPASSVARGLALLERERPDLALLDVNLAGQSVAPLAFRLKEQGVPYVLVTGYRDLAQREPELRDAPRIDKPVNRHRLLTMLAQMTAPDR